MRHSFISPTKLYVSGGSRRHKRCQLCDPGLCKFVKYFHVLPTGYRGMRRRKGPQRHCPKEIKDLQGENRFTTWYFKPPSTHLIIFSPFPVVKQKHVTGDTVVISYLKIRNNCERDFTPEMTFFRTLKIFWEFGMCSKIAQIPGDELNRQTKKPSENRRKKDKKGKS